MGRRRGIDYGLALLIIASGIVFQWLLLSGGNLWFFLAGWYR